VVVGPTGEDAPRAAKPRRQRLWLTVSEIVGVLALVLAGLNYWESHQQHQEDVRQHQEDVRHGQAAAQAASAFVVVGEADRSGRFVSLKSLKESQAIQSQRYRFPDDLADHPMEITAERPRIEADWIAPGLKRVLDEGRAKGSGEARVPLVIETTFVEDGETRTDASLYQLGVAWKRGFLGARQIRLTGLALSRRNLSGAPAQLLQSRWADAKAALGGPSTNSPSE
jgi:hypothetical protein